MISPKVTVYVTNHNYGRFIRQAIESVLAQSLQDFEMIVIDDGSTDESRSIIESYIGHPKIVPIFQQNKGLTVTNNIALRQARGEYIVRLDADDFLDPHALELLAGALDRAPSVGMVFPDYYVTDEFGTVTEIVRRHNFEQVTLLDQPAHGACTMIRRQCLLDLGGYNESLRCQDGYDLWVRFIEKFGVRNVNLPLFYYRQHGTSLTRNEDNILSTRAQIVERYSRLRGEVPKAAAVIPVRGRVMDPASPALQPLGDKTLIDWTIEAALEARHIDKVVVTTPDPDIITHVRQVYGVRVLTVERDARLALPNTTFNASVLDALDRVGGPAPDIVAELQIESPFRRGRHIDTAIEVMNLFDTDLVIAVRPESGQFYQHNGNGMEAVRAGQLRLEREELYRQVGGLQVARFNLLANGQDGTPPRIGHVVLDETAALILMTPLSWRIATMIADQSANEEELG